MIRAVHKVMVRTVQQRPVQKRTSAAETGLSGRSESVHEEVVVTEWLDRWIIRQLDGRLDTQLDRWTIDKKDGDDLEINGT